MSSETIMVVKLKINYRLWLLGGEVLHHVDVLLAGHPVRNVLMLVNPDSDALVQKLVVPIEIVVHGQLMLELYALKASPDLLLDVVRRRHFRLENLTAWQVPRGCQRSPRSATRRAENSRCQRCSRDKRCDTE